MSDDKHPTDVPFFLQEAEEEEDDVFTSLGSASPVLETINPQLVELVPEQPSIKIPKSTHGKLVVLTPNDEILGEHQIVGSRFLLGREGSDLALDDPFVSKWHAQIYRNTSGALILEDLESHNGVYLRISNEFQLEDSDEIIAGQQRFIFHKSSFPPALPQLAGSPFVRSVGGQKPGAFPHLVHVFEDGHLGGLYPLNNLLAVGRNQSDITCPNDLSLAPQHMTIEKRGTSYFLSDLGSAYGTFVRLSGSIELFQGDCFLIGRSRITLVQKR